MIQTEIAVFCRNEAPHLVEQVRHLAGQIDALPATCQPVVLHILENGSSDESPQLAQQIQDENEYPFTVRAHIHLPPGKAKAWNYFLAQATAPRLVFVDADVRLGDQTLLNLLNRLEQKERLHLVGAVAQLPPHFTPANFWQSVFAIPYSALPPANSLAGGAYVAKRESLSAMPEDVINEDLYLSLQHEGAFACAADAPLFVTPPETLEIFLNQRARIIRSDLAEQNRNPHLNVKHHRRSGLQTLFRFWQKAGLFKTLAFLWARQRAQSRAKQPLGKPQSGWEPNRSGG